MNIRTAGIKDNITESQTIKVLRPYRDTTHLLKDELKGKHRRGRQCYMYIEDAKRQMDWGNSVLVYHEDLGQKVLNVH